MYSTESNLMLGSYVMYTSRPKDIEMNIPPNSISINGIYTLKKQCVILLQPEFQIKKGKYSIAFPITYKSWPGTFYGIGNNTDENAEEEYTSQFIEMQLSAKRRFFHKLEFDIFYEFDDYKILKLENGGILSAKEIPGSKNCLISGLGFSLIYNTRDNSFFPSKGNYFKLENTFFSDLFGSDHNFSQYKLDIRKFLPVCEGNTVAFQGLFTYTKDDAPFQKLTDLGSKMRGYNSGRFIDDHRLILRSEYRLFPWKSGKQSRVGFAGFVECGQVASSMKEIRFTELKCSGGIGLRFMLIPDEKFTLRIDYAIGKNSTDLIIISQEAF